MSDTPMTDAALEQTWQSVNVPTNPVPAEFARNLERQLAEEREQRDSLAALVGTIRQWLNLPVRNVSDISAEEHSHEIGNALAADGHERLTAACRRLIESEAVQTAWPLDGARRAETPGETHSSATARVKFRHLLAIHAALKS